MLLACALALSTLHARAAADRRVALLGGDGELLRALSLALSVWEVETISLDAPLPESSQPQAVLQARELAQRFDLDGVVWVSREPEGALLWIYDARSVEITTRVLADAPPFQSAVAAGIALSVKTVLRTSVEPPAAVQEPAPEGEPPLGRVTLRAALDGQFVADQAAQARPSLASVVWFGPPRRLGLGLTLAAGSGVDLETAAFVGRYRDVSFGPTVELRLSAGQLTASIFGGGALHVALLDGTLVRDGARAAVKRYNGSLDAGGQLDFRLGGGLFVGLGAKAEFLLSYQRYLVESKPIFSPWRITPSGGGHLGVEFF
jgi:hypothetical protein